MKIYYSLIILVLLTSCKMRDPYQKYLQRGNRYVEKELYNEAITNYKIAIRKSKDPYIAKINLAVVFSKQGNCLDAITVLKQVSAERKRIHIVQYLLARCYTKLGNLGKAYKYAKRAARLKPKDHRSLTLKAWLAYLRGRPNESMKTANRVIRKYPRLVAPKVIQAKTLLHQKRYHQAKLVLESAMKFSKNPDDKSYVLSTLGDLYLKQYNLKKAQKYHKESLEIKPFGYESLVGLGAINLARKRNTLAIQLLTQALKVDEAKPIAYYHLGRAYFNQDPTKARFFFKKFLKLSNKNPILHEKYLRTKTLLSRMKRRR